MRAHKVSFFVLCFAVVIPVYMVHMAHAFYDEETNRKRALVDELMIRMVGKRDLKENYHFVSFDKTWDLFTYRFLPGDRYGGMEYQLYHDVAAEILNPSQRCKEDVQRCSHIATMRTRYASFPSCTKDRWHCQFKVTHEQLKTIARREGVKGEKVAFLMYDGVMVAELGICYPAAQGGKKIFVDMQDGSIKWKGDNDHCPTCTF